MVGVARPRRSRRRSSAQGCSIAARVEAPATVNGGDLLWLDRSGGSFCVGRGYRTNDAGIASLRALLPDVGVLAFDLPHLGGPAPRARVRSRTASWCGSGTHTAVRSPARSCRASDSASRRLVFTRSPGFCGISDGATTMQS